MMTALARRQLATRHAPWAKRLAGALAAAGVRPNAVSLASIAAAAAACIGFAAVPHVAAAARAWLFVASAAAIQVRLLCNLLDGMLAVEHGLRSKTGELFNEIPDRIADVAILAGAGYSVPGGSIGLTLGWAAAAAAVATAYVRVLGGSLGVTQPFAGPMAKQHRMFVLTVASLGAALEAAAGLDTAAVPIALAVIIAGSIVTTWRRVERIAQQLEGR